MEIELTILAVELTILRGVEMKIFRAVVLKILSVEKKVLYDKIQ